MATMIITGASSGIGEALATCAASQGYVLGLAARSTDKLQTLADRLRHDYAVQVEVAHMDVQDEASIVQAMDDLAQKLGTIDIVVANAGVTAVRRTGRDDLSIDRGVFQTNLFGAIATLDVATRLFLSQGRGHLVGISSFSAFAPIPGSAAYSASKAALSNYMNAMRLELASRNIKVTVIHPGFIHTHLAAKMDRYPFVIEADVAARQMLQAIERQATNVIVPALPWRVVKGILQVTPDSMLSWVVQRMFDKGKKK